MSTRPRKKAKKSGESAFSQSVLESLNCPITAALPVVPVLAEDGRIYERAAIERWLSKKAKSPLTNAPMGKHLADASGTTRPLVLSAIENGVVDDESAAAWHLGSAKAKLERELPGDLSSVKIDLDKAGAFASTPEIELLRRTAAVKIRAAANKLEAESLAEETESLLKEAEAAGYSRYNFSTMFNPGEEELRQGVEVENLLSHYLKEEGFQEAKTALGLVKDWYQWAAEDGDKRAIDALARLDAIAALARLE